MFSIHFIAVMKVLLNCGNGQTVVWVIKCLIGPQIVHNTTTTKNFDRFEQ